MARCRTGKERIVCQRSKKERGAQKKTEDFLPLRKSPVLSKPAGVFLGFKELLPDTLQCQVSFSIRCAGSLLRPTRSSEQALEMSLCYFLFALFFDFFAVFFFAVFFFAFFLAITFLLQVDQ
jgi:hypothetical protein